jgi:hypothetical protein
MDAILIFFVILSTLAGLAASASSFGSDTRDVDTNTHTSKPSI